MATVKVGCRPSILNRCTGAVGGFDLADGISPGLPPAVARYADRIRCTTSLGRSNGTGAGRNPRVGLVSARGYSPVPSPCRAQPDRLILNCLLRRDAVAHTLFHQ